MNKNSVNKGCCKEERSGEAKAPEPEEEGQEVYLDLSSDEESRYITHETEDCGSDDVPHGTKSGTGSKVIKQADLVSMWKYMLSPVYANRRLALYTYLNSLLRRGHLSSTVGFKVLNRVINKEACEFTGVSFWKVDREDFYADVRVKLTLQSLTGVRTWEGILVCWCSFDDEEKFSLSVEDLTDSVDRKAEGLILLSPFLVPYLTGEKMDAFADEVWIRYGLPEAISNPSLRNATELAKRMGLQIMYLDVYEHRNMDSIIFFADSDLVVGEDRVEKQEDGNWHRIKTGFPTTVRIPADTIVVNTNKIRKDYSAFNIFHECIHYLLHYMFYRLQDMGSNDIRLVKIKEVEIEDGKNLSDPIYFMEKQANRGAFALMMPAEDTRERIREEAGKVKTYKNVGEKYEIIGKNLSWKLGYPHFRVKPRMIQLGYYETKGALNYGDNHKLIQPFAFSRDSWQESEVTFVVRESTTNMLYQRNDDFRKVMDSGEFVFADGHIVRNKPRFVKKQGDKILLTDEAAGRVDDCCLRFTRQYVQKDVGDYILGRMFYDAHYVEQTNFYLSDLINEKHLKCWTKISQIRSLKRSEIEESRGGSRLSFK